jgi:23S rRNA (uracil1939-C5)-methyltransferase
MQKNNLSIHITQLSHDGRGIGHIDGKTYFIANALPNETVIFELLRKHKKFSEGFSTEILTPSPERISPKCQHFGLCGGCQLQHMSTAYQLDYKQTMVLELLEHIAHIQPKEILPIISQTEYGYRNKARLGVKYVNKKNRLLIGFREINGRYLADIQRCEILHPKVGHALESLSGMIESLSCQQQIPQIEVAAGADNQCVLIIRHLVPLTPQDIDKIIAYGKAHDFILCLQPDNYDSVYQIYPEKSDQIPELHYILEKYNLRINFHPADFTQVNASINVEMIDKAIELLSLKPSDQVLDLFCGLGNFTLPIAKFVHAVTGVEGDEKMVAKAIKNSQYNELTHARFLKANLFDAISSQSFVQHYDKILLDPPRAGAEEIAKNIHLFSASKVVYIACNPSTFARDAAEIVKHGYTLSKLGILNMFPQTSHIETIALFEKI